MPKKARLKSWDSSSLPFNWFKRESPGDVANEEIDSTVQTIIKEVRRRGDAALIEFTEKFDKVNLKTKALLATREEIKKAYEEIDTKQVSAIEFLKEKVHSFHKHQLESSQRQSLQDGVIVQDLFRPIESVGCYVPGGRAVYPSTLVMLAVPAKIAGVKRVVACSPPNSNGEINPILLVASDICGIDEIYKVGGVQAIAAMAYGTETIKAVKKIIGPGNAYVTKAKIMVSKDVAIDMPAGPSEVLVLADETANSRFVALDMISQAEHGEDSVAGLITTSKKLAEEVQDWLERIVSTVNRAEIVKKSLEKYGFIITCDDIAKAIELTNIFAAEHVEIITSNPKEVSKKIVTAGLVLLGAFSPVALSDYASGTNHVLPTGGFGHAFSGLSSFDFVRRMSVVEGSRQGLERVENQVKILTDIETLPNHFKAIEARLENECDP